MWEIKIIEKYKRTHIHTRADDAARTYYTPQKRLTQTQNKNKWRKNILKCDIEMNDNQIIMFSHNAMVLGL